MTEHSDEAKVRAAWEKVGAFDSRPYQMTCGIHIFDGDKCIHHFGDHSTPEAAWSAAAAYTDEHEKKIAEVDEEIDLLTHDAAESDERGWGKELQTYKRILAARQAARAELMRGWRGGM